MGSRARGNGVSVMDTLSTCYRPAQLLVPEPASGRNLHVSCMCGSERDPRAFILGLSPCSSNLGPANQSLGRLSSQARWLEHCANLSVPRLSSHVTARMLAYYPEDVDQFATAWRTIWEVAGTVIITMLWQQRVNRVFHNANLTMQASEALIWARRRR